MVKPTYPCGVTQETIDDWKLKFKKVSLISVKDDDGTEKCGYFKRPDLKILSAAGTFADKDPIKSGCVMFDNCWLAGDAELKENDELKMSAIIQLNQIFRIREATLKNL